MKALFLTLTMLFAVVVTAQDIKPKLEKEGDLVKATYFHENGEVAQTGFFKAGKVHGEWRAYDIEGNKTAIAHYNAGKKVGKWFVWDGKILNEINYEDHRIVSTKKWDNGNAIVIN